MIENTLLPEFWSYGHYSSDNDGAHTPVFTDNRGRMFYFSYSTLVAVRVPGKGMAVHENIWSATTGKHLDWIDGGYDKDCRLSAREFAATVADWLGEKEVVAEEFDSVAWGAQRKAIAARSRRAKVLEGLGYEVDFATRYYGLSGENRGYRLFAHKPGEVKMQTPEKIERSAR